VRARVRAQAALAAAAALLPFLPALHAGFLAWDDRPNLLDNSAWRGFAWENLRWMLTTHWRGPWQPLSWLSYALDRALWGLDAPAFRRTNLLLHALAAALAVLVAARLLEAALAQRVPERARRLGALAAGLFFALHPLRVESVVWITERRDVLSGAFLLAAWLMRLEGRALLGPALFACALLSKGTAVALPFFLLACEVYPFARLSADPRRWAAPPARSVLLGLAPYFALAAAAGAMNLLGLRAGELAVPALSLGKRLLLAAHSAGFYLHKTFWPSGLSPYYALPRDWAAAAPRLAAGAALSAAALAAAWLGRRRAPWALPAFLAYLAALAPVSGLLQNGAQLAADRYSYLPCLPFAFVVGGFAAAFAARRPRAAAGLVAAGALALGALACRQALYWRSDKALWARAVELSADAYLPRSNYAQALNLSGDKDGALAQFPEVVRLEPRDAQARVNWAVLLEERGRLAEAERLLREAYALDPGAPETTVDLAGLLARRGARSEALGLLEALAARRPGFAPGRFDLGLLLLSCGRKAEGVRHLREAVRLDPSLARRLGQKKPPGASRGAFSPNVKLSQ